MDKIAVLIPCKDEATAIVKVVNDFRQYLPEAVVYVYDNNSVDDTARLAAEAGAVVRREPQQGKGNVIRRMFREIDAECYLMVDGDDTYPAEAAGKLVDAVLKTAPTWPSETACQPPISARTNGPCMDSETR